ncbi:MAG: short-subunit dehydrogenase, partial [Kiritimatiellia bacterium]
MSDTVEKINVWVTGATSGIGLALTEQLSREGYRVFISARDEAKLKQIADDNSDVIAIPFDITDEQAIDSVRQQLLNHTDTLEQVFMNAGSCEYLELSDPDWSMVKRITDINFIGAVNTVAVALPLLKNQALNHHTAVAGQAPKLSGRKQGGRKKSWPQIVGVSSMATLVAFPKSEAYGASKAGLNYFLQSLRLDLRSQGIAVTTVLPGFVKTPLTDNNTFDMPFIITADVAAQRIIKGVASRPRVFAFPKRLYWILRLCKLFPEYWEKRLSA